MRTQKELIRELTLCDESFEFDKNIILYIDCNPTDLELETIHECFKHSAQIQFLKND